MVLVDTSVWIRLHRERDHPVGRILWQLALRDEAAICGAVWLEFIGGFRDPKRRDATAQRLSVFPWLETERAAYEKATEWKVQAPKLGTVDLIIAGTALVNEAAVLTLDLSFRALQKHGLRVLTVG